MNMNLDTQNFQWHQRESFGEAIGVRYLAACGWTTPFRNNPCNYMGWALAFQLLPMTHSTKGRSPFQLQSSWQQFWFSTCEWFVMDRNLSWLLLKIYTVRKPISCELCVCLFFPRSELNQLTASGRAEQDHVYHVSRNVKKSEWYSIEFIQYIGLCFVRDTAVIPTRKTCLKDGILQFNSGFAWSKMNIPKQVRVFPPVQSLEHLYT